MKQSKNDLLTFASNTVTWSLKKSGLEYFAGNESIAAETAVSSLEDIYNLAKKAGGSIKFIQPLEHGLQAAIDKILENHEMLSFTEIYNMYGTIDTKESDFVIFANFIKLLNEGNQVELIHFLNTNKLTFNQRNLKMHLNISSKTCLFLLLEAMLPEDRHWHRAWDLF